MYKIREARSDDFHMIAGINDNPDHLHLANLEPTFQKENFDNQLLDKHTRFYVVEKSKQVAAYILFHVKMEDGVLYIDKLSMDRFYENKGLDEHLYHKTERFAVRLGIKKMAAAITGNAFLDFFERKGWEFDPNKEMHSLSIGNY